MDYVLVFHFDFLISVESHSLTEHQWNQRKTVVGHVGALVGTGKGLHE
jgi:hypothetical protein